jgi:hypothetical protein
MLAAFLSFPLFTEYNCALMKVDRLADCIALKVVGVYFSFSSGIGAQCAPSSSKWETRADT